jgi:hypothetical protein
MSAWRRKALTMLPELRRELQAPRTTVMLTFFELRWLCRDAHRSRNLDLLERIYGFAAWCARHPAREVWNAAGVGFYEHLPDDPVTLADFTRWVPHDVFRDVETLLHNRLGAQGVAALRLQYQKRSASPRRRRLSKGPPE